MGKGSEMYSYRQQVADDNDVSGLIKVPWGQLGFYMVAVDRQLKNEWYAHERIHGRIPTCILWF